MARIVRSRASSPRLVGEFGLTAIVTPPPPSRARALVGPLLMTLAMLIILIALGLWQLQRRSWKLALLADIDRAEASAPIPLPDQPLPFTKVRVTGHLRSDLSALYGVDVRSVPGRGNSIGAQLIQPLERSGEPPLLVDRGWIREGQADTQAGEVTIVGYIREPASPNWFSPADDLAARHFYTLDPARIGAALGLPRVAPFTLVALGEGGTPDPASALPRPPNDHLNYALTWFGLALSLVAVFGAYVRKVFRA